MPDSFLMPNFFLFSFLHFLSCSFGNTLDLFLPLLHQPPSLNSPLLELNFSQIVDNNEDKLGKNQKLKDELSHMEVSMEHVQVIYDTDVEHVRNKTDKPENDPALRNSACRNQSHCN